MRTKLLSGILILLNFKCTRKIIQLKYNTSAIVNKKQQKNNKIPIKHQQDIQKYPIINKETSTRLPYIKARVIQNFITQKNADERNPSWISIDYPPNTDDNISPSVPTEKITNVGQPQTQPSPDNQPSKPNDRQTFRDQIINLCSKLRLQSPSPNRRHRPQIRKWRQKISTYLKTFNKKDSVLENGDH